MEVVIHRHRRRGTTRSRARGGPVRRGYEKIRLGPAPSADNDLYLYPEKRAEWEAQGKSIRPAR